ncbi:MAG: amino acid ABC transporter ATP-binding protein [Bdellovibrionales bacterium]|nr:amino acid ABC transporter ATP-binding protein [Bdellovibrionales bacterium]
MISIKNLHKSYGTHEVLKGISLEVQKQEVVAIIGPSGSGKSSFIRTINGLETFQQGEIVVDGVRVLPDTYNQSLTKKVGMVFQSFNLFPHMSVIDNITLAPMEVKKAEKEKAIEQAKVLLKKVDLSAHAYKYPHQLSGGQQQRVAIARALALDPQVMLFDEVTSALDPEITHEVLNVMKDLAVSGMTMLVVTHEMNFAEKVADRVIFFDSGIIIEEGDPSLFFKNPATDRARSFLNQMA